MDMEIRSRFAGSIQSQPSHVYARPLVLTKKSAFDADKLINVLRRKNYRPAMEISEPGDYARAGDIIDVYIRQFPQGSDDFDAQAVRIEFSGNRVMRIIDHQSAEQLQRIVLEPPLIGSLQLGPYKDRISLRLHQMPELLIRALLAMEDRNFETHFGLDPKAIIRALWSNLQSGKAVQGGSTLTQQLVKNLFLSPQRTVARKITEALMAVIMELRFDKGEILEMYLNEIFLGQSGNRAVHGFALASEHYFGRPVQELKLHETALLIGMIPAPSYYNPRRHPQRALKRRNRVIGKLAEIRAISRHTAQSLQQKPLGIVQYRSQTTSDFPAYTDYLHRQLRQSYPEDVLRQNGLKLYASLDLGIQSVAQSTLTDMLAELETQKGFPGDTLQGAVIVVDPGTGEILALVGDRKKGYFGFNRALDAQRPIGSLVKPAIYLGALAHSNRYSLASMVDDSPLTLRPKGGKAWSPQNYDNQFRGYIPLYQGLIESYNLPAVRIGLDLGIDQVADTMNRLGIDREIQTYPSTLLGASQLTPMEIAQMYQVFANDGVLTPLHSLRTIRDHHGRILSSFAAGEQRVIDEQSMFLINHALRMVVSSGTAAGLTRSFRGELRLAGKTGTTDNFRDSWFAGYSGNLLAIVWVGRDDNKPARLSGSAGAMRVWERLMSQLPLTPPATDAPAGIILARIDPQSGLVANERCANSVTLPFIAGSEPGGFAPCAGLAIKTRSWPSIREGGLANKQDDGRR